MFDFDLSELYQVETRVLNQAVKRNVNRFPEDFMFRLSVDEWTSISSQFVMTSRTKRPKSALPFVFTEHGVFLHIIARFHSEMRGRESFGKNFFLRSNLTVFWLSK